jgi:Fic family protein
MLAVPRADRASRGGASGDKRERQLIIDFLYKPKYAITDEILTLTANIAAKADVLTVHSGMAQNPKLRKANLIRSIHSSLAIENNSLSLDQVTALLDGKRVLAPPQDICEVQNAFQAYNRLLEFNPYDVMDLLTAHRILMKDLVKEPGQFRSGNIGVVRGREVVHIAPPPENVSGLMADLLRWTEGAAVHPLIKSCVFHYEFEFIHPFSDGNGRMGRMWQTLLLYRWKEIFAWLPVETIVYDRQNEYYAALGSSNDAGDCTDFIRFMLQAIWDATEKYLSGDQIGDQVSAQVKQLLDLLGAKTLSAVELMGLLNLKHRPTFRKNYLHPALDRGLIEMTLPNAPNSRNQRYKRKN